MAQQDRTPSNQSPGDNPITSPVLGAPFNYRPKPRLSGKILREAPIQSWPTPDPFRFVNPGNSGGSAYGQGHIAKLSTKPLSFINTFASDVSPAASTSFARS